MEKRLGMWVEEEIKLEKFLRSCMELTERQVRQAKFRQNGICVNGVQSRVSRQLKSGEWVEVLLENEESVSRQMEVYKKSIEVLYEDEDVIIVNKPAGIVVHPAHGHYQDTLSNMLVNYFVEKKEQVRIRSVGRLDKDTSGIVVFAKNQITAARLAKQRQEGRMKKEYLALVSGIPRPSTGSIAIGIEKAEKSLTKMSVSRTGKSALTFYRVCREFEGYALVKLNIPTGRTHQIRVHMAYHGHPLLGDSLYGNGSCEITDGAGINRAALHACKVSLIQPFTKEKIVVEAILPDDMRSCLNRKS